PRVLEIGSGTGDLTRHLTPFAGSVHAVEPASRMCEVFRARRFAGCDVTLVQGDAETAPLDPPYDLAVAGESLHWTEWGVALPRIGAALRSGAHLAVVERSQDPLPCAAELGRLIARYSTNQDYAPYDLIDELATRDLFQVRGRASVPPVVVQQPIDVVIESMHSRNGFSRARMSEDAAQAFDRAFAALLAQDYPDGIVPLAVGAEVVWGRPAPRR
ncbi:MAG: methyltransferase domain-containing protein, partial [Planctomycetota bacterium]|nr:methyltransferase domain-containing protein [Planctomycetota bacterium]